MKIYYLIFITQTKQSILLKRLIWRDTKKDIGLFNKIDCAYFQAIIDESRRKDKNESWINILENIVLYNKT